MAVPRLYSSPRALHHSSKLARSSTFHLRPQFIETSLKQQPPPLTSHYRLLHQANRQPKLNSSSDAKPSARIAASLESSFLSKTLLVGFVSVGGVAAYLYTMSSKLVPSHPSEVMVIRNITPNVVTLSVPFARFGVLKVGGRGTIVRLTSGALAVFSPVALTEEVKQKVKELGGNLKYIVALDIEHHIFISEWKKEYPKANIIGPEGLPEKRAKATDEKIGKEEFEVVFDSKKKADKKLSISEEFDADFEFEYVDAHPGKELVFFYKPDRVLIEADLMFNLPAIEQYSRVTDHDKDKPDFRNRLWTSLQTTEGEAKGAKRFIWHVLSRGNRPSFNESVKRIAAWDFVTLIPCHGETIEGTGKETFLKVFEWHLKA